jgi:DNA-binding NarL/FixJ family response regulator
MRNILVVDDHPFVVPAISAVLSTQFRDTAIVAATSAAEMRQKLDAMRGAGTPFELVFLDLNLPDANGIDVLAEMCAVYHTPVIVLTGHNDPHIVRMCKKNGAAGFIRKSAQVDAYLAAIGAVQRGEQYFPGIEAIEKAEKHDPIAQLTERERQILDRLILGQPNKTIAIDLEIGEGYVRNVVSHLFDTFEVAARTRTQLAAIVTQRGYQPVTLSAKNK